MLFCDLYDYFPNRNFFYFLTMGGSKRVCERFIYHSSRLHKWMGGLILSTNVSGLPGRTISGVFIVIKRTVGRQLLCNSNWLIKAAETCVRVACGTFTSARVVMGKSCIFWKDESLNGCVQRGYLDKLKCRAQCSWPGSLKEIWTCVKQRAHRNKERQVELSNFFRLR